MDSQWGEGMAQGLGCLLWAVVIGCIGGGLLIGYFVGAR